MDNQPPPHTPMRVVFCTSPSIYSAIVLQELLRSPHVALVGVIASTRILRKKGWNWWDSILLVRRSGLRYAVYLLMVTSLHTLLGRLFRNDAVGDYLTRMRVPKLHTRDINCAAGIAFVQNCNPDFLLSAHFNQLIGVELLALPPQGCLNIHPGLLPKYKGVDPVIQALANSEQEVGVTIHFQDQGFDSGPVIIDGKLPVLADDSLFSLNCKLFKRGISLLMEKIAVSGSIPCGTPQVSSDNYDSWPNACLVGNLIKSGRKLINLTSFLARCRGNSV